MADGCWTSGGIRMIHLANVSKVFGTGAAGLSNISLTIDKGEFVFLVGHTGSGKTTLLKLLIRDMLPTEGTITVGDMELVGLPAKQIPHLRKKIGFVFQDLKLLMDRTIVENVMLPLEIIGFKHEDATKRVEDLLARVGMIEHKDKFPVQLSGGELQRVAIARALTLSPDILLADEPTGNLDAKTAFDIVELLSQINAAGTTIIMATHNLDLLKKYAKNRIVALEKGKVMKDNKQSKEAHHIDEKETKKEPEKTEKKGEKQK